MTARTIFLHIGATLMVAVFLTGTVAVLVASWSVGGGMRVPLAFAATNASTTVVIGNSAPTVTNVVLNGAAAITLTANTTTAVSVNATISDNNGCSDITGGTTTVMIYRSSVTSSTCLTTASDLNCYRATVFTASSTCSSGTQNTTTTFNVYYFANATDASSSFSSQNWIATVIFRDPSNATGSEDATGQELNTLTALDVTTSSINYGTLSASSTTGGTNQITTSTNAGNSTTTLRLSAVNTLTSGSNSIVTSSQKYASTTFTCCGNGPIDLTDTPVTFAGLVLTTPTTTTNVAQEVYWGLSVAAGTATGTYNGTNLFTALFQP